jgi:predicted metallo-beta-lactamase superfamily hydrolase
MRLDGKQIYIQPIIISYEHEFFYFFPDVQGMPNRNDYELLISIKNEFEAINHQFVSDQSSHIIAMGGPITFLLQRQNAIHLLEQALIHTNNIANNFDQLILDHHLVRDPNFMTYWEIISQNSTAVHPFNPNLLNEIKKENENIPVLEFNREKLYKIFPT